MGKIHDSKCLNFDFTAHCTNTRDFHQHTASHSVLHVCDCDIICTWAFWYSRFNQNMIEICGYWTWNYYYSRYWIAQIMFKHLIIIGSSSVYYIHRKSNLINWPQLLLPSNEFWSVWCRNSTWTKISITHKYYCICQSMWGIFIHYIPNYWLVQCSIVLSLLKYGLAQFYHHIMFKYRASNGKLVVF